MSLQDTTKAASHLPRLTITCLVSTIDASDLDLVELPNLATPKSLSTTDYTTSKLSIADMHQDRGMSVLSALVMLYTDDAAEDIADGGSLRKSQNCFALSEDREIL